MHTTKKSKKLFMKCICGGSSTSIKRLQCKLLQYSFELIVNSVNIDRKYNLVTFKLCQKLKIDI